MLETAGEIAGALKAFGDFYHPKTNSILMTSGSPRDPHSDPFRRGFIDSLEIRTELLRRLAKLEERDRNLVMLWYVSDVPARDLCARIGVSRATLYRMRDKALQQMVEPEDTRTVASA